MSEDDTAPSGAPREAPPIPRMSESELREFVTEYCNGQIFTSANLPEDSDALGMVFMPLAFGAITEESAKEIGIVWERLSDAGARYINGTPMFFSMHIMHKDDWARAAQAIHAELQRRKEIPV